MADIDDLVHAFRARQAHPEQMGHILDELMAMDQLDPILTQLSSTMSHHDFGELHSTAIERASVFIGKQGETLQAGILIALPIVAEERTLPTIDADFWERLSKFAQAALDDGTVKITALTGLVQPSTITHLRLGAWHHLLRESVSGLPPVYRDHLKAVDAAKADAYTPIASDQVVALTQRLALGVLHYDPDHTPCAPFQAFKEWLNTHPDEWKTVVNAGAGVTVVGTPQPVRDTVRLALQQKFQIALMVARRHRDLADDCAIAWQDIQSDEYSVTFIPRSGDITLDPIQVSHSWLNLVGGPDVESLLSSLAQEAPAAEDIAAMASPKRRATLH